MKEIRILFQFYFILILYCVEVISFILTNLFIIRMQCKKYLDKEIFYKKILFLKNK